MQHYVGLDVSVKETSVCIVDKAGKVIREPNSVCSYAVSPGSTIPRHYSRHLLQAIQIRRDVPFVKTAAMSNIIQTRPHNRLRLSNTARFPVTSPRLKERARDTRRCIGSCPSSVCMRRRTPRSILLRGEA